MDILDILKEDYARFPDNPTYEIYATDVYFRDPLNEFKGIDRYRQNIRFIATWFKHIQLDLHDIRREENAIVTNWTLSWNAPLPWKPRIAIPGWSELKLDGDDRIIAHIDGWNCSRFDVLKQHFSFS